MSFNVGTSGKSKGSLGASDKHNERKYKSNSLENTNSNINFELSKNNEILRGTRDLYKDVEKTYKEEFTKAVEDYNAKQKRNDRKIYDYFQKISDDKKTNLYTEVVVQVGDNEFWKNKNLEEKKQMVEVFNKQLEIIEKEYPNFKISNATAHFDETSPHMHIIGVCVSDRETALKNKDDKKVSKRKNGLEKYVSQSEIFTQKNLLEFHKIFDEKSLKVFNEVYKTNEVLNDKKLHQEHLDLKTFKMSAEKIKEAQKEFDDLKLKKEEVKNDIKDLEKEKSNLENLKEENKDLIKKLTKENEKLYKVEAIDKNVDKKRNHFTGKIKSVIMEEHIYNSLLRYAREGEKLLSERNEIENSKNKLQDKYNSLSKEVKSLKEKNSKYHDKEIDDKIKEVKINDYISRLENEISKEKKEELKAENDSFMEIQNLKGLYGENRYLETISEKVSEKGFESLNKEEKKFVEYKASCNSELAKAIVNSAESSFGEAELGEDDDGGGGSSPSSQNKKNQWKNIKNSFEKGFGL